MSKIRLVQAEKGIIDFRLFFFFSTEPFEVRPPSPSKPEVTAFTERSVTLSWKQTASAAHKPILQYAVLVRYVKLTTDMLTSSVRPPSPSKPEVTAFTERSVTLSWKQTASAAHKPILQYAVLVRSTRSGEERTVTLYGNNTSATVSGLLPLTQYSFSVSAENAAGMSEFSPSVIYRTLGEALTNAPIVESLRNTSEGCVNVTWKSPPNAGHSITGYRVMVHRMGTGTMREWHTKDNEHALCGLPFNSAFMISIEADNGYGYSPSATSIFYTDQSVPDGPPEGVEAHAISSSTITLIWSAPRKPNGIIIAYQIYVKRADDNNVRTIRLKVRGDTPSRCTYNISDLAPYTKYTFRLSAFTAKGEGDRSEELSATTDYAVPPSPKITNITFNCRNTVTVTWIEESDYGQFYQLLLEGATPHSFNTTRRKGLRADIFAEDRNAYTSITLRCIVRKKKFVNAEEKYCDESRSLVYDRNCGQSISVERFDEYCREMSANDNQQFRRQFEEIEKDSSLVDDFALDEHRSKDRYLNISAFESTRIKIASGSCDYINANYVDQKISCKNNLAIVFTSLRQDVMIEESCETKRAYIATQAPLPHTFADFWEMVWQEHSNLIVAITKLVEHGRRKCDQYWPCTVTGSQTHGHYTVTLDMERPNAHFVHRLITLKSSRCLMTERKVHQLHFTSWPDHGVPTSVFPILSFLKYVSEVPTTGPIVVHCSAGVGRSGSFMLIDSMRRHLLISDSVNIEAHLRHIRQQRAKLVQTLDICKCPHSPTCTNPIGYEVFPGYHKEAEFIVATWPKETEALWELIWEKNCQTVVVLGGHSEFWQNIETAGELTIQRNGDDTTIISSNEDQAKIERIQQRRLQYHQSPLMVLNPQNNSTAYILCVLTSIACQLEAESCLDVLQLLAAYKHKLCNVWRTQCDIEIIYDKLLILVQNLQHSTTCW
uniref:Protein-tyrosine-phosphatase n=1 Tax=Ascaris lumbricoides TaxID=6252 RepID=A0A9J2PH80_ASCLU